MRPFMLLAVSAALLWGVSAAQSSWGPAGCAVMFSQVPVGTNATFWRCPKCNSVTASGFVHCPNCGYTKEQKQVGANAWELRPNDGEYALYKEGVQVGGINPVRMEFRWYDAASNAWGNPCVKNERYSLPLDGTGREAGKCPCEKGCKCDNGKPCEKGSNCACRITPTLPPKQNKANAPSGTCACSECGPNCGCTFNGQCRDQKKQPSALVGAPATACITGCNCDCNGDCKCGTNGPCSGACLCVAKKLVGPVQQKDLKKEPGLMKEHISKHKQYTVNGIPMTEEVAKGLLAGDNKMEDDSNQPWLTIIGTEEERKRVLEDLDKAPELAPWKGKLRVQAYPPDHWAVRPGFKTDGHPTIYVQKASGEDLHRQDGYNGPALMATVLANANLGELRTPKPYDPNKDPNLNSPLADPFAFISAIPMWGWIVIALAVFVFLNKKEAK